MSNTLLATIGGLAALGGWGISDYLAAKNSRKFNGFEVNAAIQLPGLIILTLVLLISHQHMPVAAHVAAIILAALCFTSAYLFFIKAFSIGAVGIVAPIANSFPLITLILSVIFLSTHFSGLQIICIMLIIFGAVLLAHEKRKIDQPFKIIEKEVALALGATFMWGLGFFVINTVVGKEKWQIVTGILSIAMGIIAFILLATKRSSFVSSVKRLKTNHIGLIAGTVLTSSTIVFYYVGQRTGSILIPIVIGSAGPLFTSLLAAVIDKEHIDLVRRTGAVIVVVGIVLLNLA